MKKKIEDKHIRNGRVTLGLWINKDIYEKLSIRAKKNDMTISAYVRYELAKVING